MKKMVLFVSIFLLIALGIVNASDKKVSIEDEFCIDYTQLDKAGSQASLNEAAYNEFKKADNKLNEIYKKIFDEYKGEKLFLEKLAQAEKKWIEFRDAHLEALYPGENKQELYGSSYLMAYYLEKAQLTWDRVKQLYKWIEGVPEGTLGSGSIKIKQQKR